MEEELWWAARDNKANRLRELLSGTGKKETEWVNDSWHGWTPLEAASNLGHLSCVELLLNAGANTNHQDRYGRTALQLASNMNELSIVSILLSAGADVDLADFDGVTALMRAAFYGNSAVAKVLLDAGASRELKSAHGETALDVAVQSRRDEVATVLRDDRHAETSVLPAVLAALFPRILPEELAQMCGDFSWFAPQRRAIERRNQAR